MPADPEMLIVPWTMIDWPSLAQQAALIGRIIQEKQWWRLLTTSEIEDLEAVWTFLHFLMDQAVEVFGPQILEAA